MRDTALVHRPARGPGLPITSGLPVTSDLPMPYRPEIDGLRAVAVASVALSHAGFAWFRGGFVGVDVFFVISGYLITTIILHGLEAGDFSLAAFYGRRARRLLPALFLVMAVSSYVAYLWMLPDDLEKFGKSLIATTLFANNIEVLRTSGYWSLAAEFKPLLHTWSLAVEEQYYIAFPLLMILAWRPWRRKASWLLGAMAVASLLAAQWTTGRAPMYAFFLLPMRIWELLIGGLVAFHLDRGRTTWASAAHRTAHPVAGQALGGLGLLAVVLAVLCFGPRLSGPGLHTLLPTCGTALILAFATERTLVFRLLSARVLVGFGLISYSFYLWHVPVLAFARIYLKEAPGPWLLGALLVLTVPVAWASWRFVERPFRSKARFGGGVALPAAVLSSCIFIGYGAYLTVTHGAPSRLGAGERTAREAFHVAYNARVFGLKKDAFDATKPLRMLVVGDSFARDFINMTTETFDLTHVDIVYRDDYDNCMATWGNLGTNRLFTEADLIVFAGRNIDYSCIDRTLALAKANHKTPFYVGTKHFGANLNWIMRLDPAQRRNRFNPMLRAILDEERKTAASIPPENYVSLLAPIMLGDTVPITDEDGRLISQDRRHVTKDGAIYIGRRALLESAYGNVLRKG